MFVTLREALAALDPSDDKAWTKDGAPSVEAVNSFLIDRRVSRAEISTEFPTFTRSNPVLPEEANGDNQESAGDEIVGAEKASAEAEAVSDEEDTAAGEKPTLAASLRHYLDTARLHHGRTGMSPLDASFRRNPKRR